MTTKIRCKMLIPLVGGGGLTAMVVAYWGSRRPIEVREGTKDATIGIQALLADHFAMQSLTSEVKRLADAMEGVAKAGNRVADMMDIARAIERLQKAND